MRHALSLTLVAVVAACGELSWLGPRESIVPRTYPSAGAFPLVSMADLRAKLLDSGIYNIECVVRSVIVCGRCAAGADCADCLPEGVRVGEDNTANYATQVFVNAAPAKQFSEGRRYLLSVWIRGRERAAYWDWASVVGYSSPP